MNRNSSLAAWRRCCRSSPRHRPARLSITARRSSIIPTRGTRTSLLLYNPYTGAHAARQPQPTPTPARPAHSTAAYNPYTVRRQIDDRYNPTPERRRIPKPPPSLHRHHNHSQAAAIRTPAPRTIVHVAQRYTGATTHQGLGHQPHDRNSAAHQSYTNPMTGNTAMRRNITIPTRQHRGSCQRNDIAERWADLVGRAAADRHCRG